MTQSPYRAERARTLDRAREPGAFDLVVVGGGITGAGVAREAARRGVKTLLLEQRDFLVIGLETRLDDLLDDVRGLALLLELFSEHILLALHDVRGQTRGVNRLRV